MPLQVGDGKRSVSFHTSFSYSQCKKKSRESMLAGVKRELPYDTYTHTKLDDFLEMV